MSLFDLFRRPEPERIAEPPVQMLGLDDVRLFPGGYGMLYVRIPRTVRVVRLFLHPSPADRIVLLRGISRVPEDVDHRTVAPYRALLDPADEPLWEEEVRVFSIFDGEKPMPASLFGSEVLPPLEARDLWPATRRDLDGGDVVLVSLVHKDVKADSIQVTGALLVQ